MENTHLSVALWDLIEAIEAIMLGGVQGEVIEQAGQTLIRNWNDHNEAEDRIDEAKELENWANRLSNERSSIIRDSIDQGRCPCGEDH
jgi:hypothetical protein